MLNLYWFLAAVAGAGLWTAVISASLTVVLLGAALLVQRDSLPTGGYGRYPWWIWTGGFAGAAYVLAAVVFARSLGVAMLFAAVIVGQLTAGLVIAHFGWFNVPVHRVSPERLIGAALLVAGMALIRWR